MDLKPCASCGGKSHFRVRTTTSGYDLCRSHLLPSIYPCFGNHSNGVMTKADQPLLTGNARTVGVEVEGNWGVEDALRLNNNTLVGIQHDGSLRGADALECVSPVLQSDTIRDWYIDLHVERMRTYNRTGEHWWFGTLDMSPLDINKLLYYCVMHQNEFMQFVPVSRAPQSKYDHSGRPLLISWEPRIHSSKDGFIRSLYGMTSEELMTNKTDSNGQKLPKYRLSKRANDKDVTYPGPIHRSWWLNVHSYFFMGGKAIEVRLKHSSRNPVVGLAWLDLWLAILENIKGMTKSDLDSTCLHDIAPALSVALLKDLEPVSFYKSQALTQQKLHAIWKTSKAYKEAK